MMKPLPIALGILVPVVLFGYWLWTPDLPRETLEARYLQQPGDLIDVAGIRLNVRDRGPRAAPAVILVHGFAGSLQTWDAWADGLAVDRRVIRFDLPGSALSAPDPTGRYTDARTGQVLIALMDQLGIERASIVGHSVGGRIAWTFAAQHPERVDKLVLVAPDGFASPGFDYGRAPEVSALFGLMRYVLPKPLLRMQLNKTFADTDFVTDERVALNQDLLRAPGSRDALLARGGQTVLIDPVPLLRTIQAPTLLLWGEQDEMIPTGNAADYLAALPNARLVTFDKTGHLPQEEAAARSLAVVEKFLDE